VIVYFWNTSNNRDINTVLLILTDEIYHLHLYILPDVSSAIYHTRGDRQ